MRFPVEGTVTAVDAEAYTCDVHPLNSEMSLLPRCRVLSVWGTSTKRLVLLPAVGSKVMVGFEDGDHTRPYIQGFFPDQGPGEMSMILESEQARVKPADFPYLIRSIFKVFIPPSASRRMK